MSDLSAKTLLILWEAAAAAGVDTYALDQQLPVDLADLRERRARVRWDDLVDTVEVLERAGCGPAELEAIGRKTVHVPSYRFIRRVAGSLVRPNQIYWAAFRWLRPVLFPNLEMTQSETGDGRIVLDVHIPDGYRPSAGFFYLIKGSGMALPEILGLPQADVSADIAPRQARITVAPPPAGSLLWRLRRMSGALLSPWALVEELGRQQEEIKDSWVSLTQSRRDMQQVIEHLPDAVVVHRDGLVVYANPAMIEALGLGGPSDVVGRPITELVHPEERDSARSHLLEPASTAHEPGSRNLRLCRGEGGTVQLEFSPAQIIHFEGRPAVLTVARDVTDRWRMTEQLARADRLSSLGRLAAGVAHELNNPLAYIELNLHLLQRAHEHIRDDRWKRKAQQAVEAAAHGASRAKTIVRDLGTFSRPELETIELLDVHPVLDAAVAMLGKELEHRARVVCDYRARRKVMANRARLEQVFLNLILNAVQAFSEDCPADNVIELRTHEDAEGRVTVAVEDNGAGIDRKQLERVFDPFFTTKPVGEGTGLGLAICHGIVTRLGGQIGLRSELGRGATFTVALPAADPDIARPAAPAPKPPPPPPTTRARILVIDDEPALARALKSLIEELHDVEVTTSGREGLRLLVEGDFDVVFCDLMMVDFSGMDLYDELQRRSPDLLEKVIFMTGGAFTQQARDFLERVPNRCLHKPFRIEIVLELIAETASAGADAPPSAGTA